MFHYKEKVCLIQIASSRFNLVIDPLSIKDLSPLDPIFHNIKIKKIFHGADYDVRSLFRDFNIEINNLFDTQIACTFLGIKEISLHAVVRSRFGVLLDKKYQKRDWSLRPLPKEMIDYAVQDVIYLVPLAKVLEKELNKKKRLDWVKEECVALSKVRPALMRNQPLFYNFKGAGRLDPRSLLVLEAILNLREKIAKKKDRPLFRIISNDAVRKITKEKPTTLKCLQGCKVLSEKQIDMYGDSIVKGIENALRQKNKLLPVYPHQEIRPLPSGTSERIKKLKAWRDKSAKKLKLDPTVLFNKAALTAIARQNPACKKDLDSMSDLKNWQKRTFGRDVISVLRSKDAYAKKE